MVYTMMKKNILLQVVLLCILVYAAFPTENTRFLHISQENANWTAVISGKSIFQPQKTSYGFAVLTDGRMISACSENGIMLWQRAVPGKPDPYLTVLDGDFLVSVSGKKKVSLINPGGLPLWTVEVPFYITATPSCGRDSRIYLRGSELISCYGIKGICKWLVKTPLQNSLPIEELNDGSILVFLEKTVDGKSTAIRISPFGEIMEEITFTGIITSASSCSDGVLLVFAGGGVGLCAVKDNTAATAWVLGASDSIFAGLSHTSYSFLVPMNTSQTALVQPGAGGAFITIINSSSGKIIRSFTASGISCSDIVYSECSGSSLILADSKTAAMYDVSGSCVWNADLPSSTSGNQKWNYLTYTDTNYLVVAGTSWAVTGYRTIQKMPGKTEVNKFQAKLADYSTFYNKFAVPPVTFTYRDTLDPTLTSEERIHDLQAGLYGKKEQQWAGELLSTLQTYLSYKRNIFSGGREESSAFTKDSAAVDRIIRQTPLYGTALFPPVLASIILSETDSFHIKSLINAAKECSYDPDGSLLNALDTITYKLPSSDESLFTAECDAVYEICRFMGRPAFFSHGKDILTRLLYPQYSSRVRAYARDTLVKIAALKI